MKRIISLLLSFIIILTLSAGIALAAGINTSAILKQGSSGEQVKYLQMDLNGLNYSVGTVDGSYGSKTTSAVRNFQSANGLSVDGVAGPNTLTKISSIVSGIQNKLNTLGYNAGTADGIYGANTKTAVTAFQRANNLSADGIAGSQTINKLNSTQPVATPKITLKTVISSANTYKFSISTDIVASKATLFLNGDSTEYVMSSTNKKDWSWSSNKINAGNRTVTFRAYDSKGNYNTATLNFTANTTSKKTWKIDIKLPKNRNNTGILKLYDANDKVVQTSTCLGKSVSGDPMNVYYGNTPTGNYTGELGGVQSNTDSYGPYQVVKLYGGDCSSTRSGIWIHGGRSQTTLSATNGCVRIFNADQKKLAENITKLISSGCEKVGSVRIYEE